MTKNIVDIGGYVEYYCLKFLFMIERTVLF